MKLTIVKSEYLDDWYIIERAEHDGKAWLERTGPNSGALRCSSRFSDACVEGSGVEMRAIAFAIQANEGISFRRCAVSFEVDGVHFCSPRNSTEDGVVTGEEAQELAKLILEKVPE